MQSKYMSETKQSAAQVKSFKECHHSSITFMSKSDQVTRGEKNE